MRRWKSTAVTVFGYLSVVAVVILVVWVLEFASAMGGGGISVGHTSAQYVSTGRDGRIALLIWTDLTGQTGSSADGGLFGATCNGYASSPDGRRVDWRWKAPKEKGGDFRINGTRYDLAGGTLFLVSTKGGQVRVTQLDADLSKVRTDGEGIETFAKNQPEVARFIAEASGPKWTAPDNAPGPAGP